MYFYTALYKNVTSCSFVKNVLVLYHLIRVFYGSFIFSFHCTVKYISKLNGFMADRIDFLVKQVRNGVFYRFSISKLSSADNLLIDDPRILQSMSMSFSGESRAPFSLVDLINLKNSGRYFFIKNLTSNQDWE